MLDLTNLMEYQKNALKVKKIENEFKESQVRQKLMRARKYLMDSQELMKKHDAEAADMNLRFKSMAKQLEEAVGVLEDINVAMENVEEDESLIQIKMLQKNAKEQQDKIKVLERDINNHMKLLYKITSDLEKMAANVPRAKKEYTNYKKLYDEELAAVNEQTLPIKKELKALEQVIDAELIRKYNQVAISHPIVLVQMKGRMCTGCNMELPATFAKKIEEAESPLECENCGRLLYIKK